MYKKCWWDMMSLNTQIIFVGSNSPETPSKPIAATKNEFVGAKTMRSGRISHGTAPFEDSKLHHLITNTSSSIFYVVVYAQAALCGVKSPALFERRTMTDDGFYS